MTDQMEFKEIIFKTWSCLSGFLLYAQSLLAKESLCLSAEWPFPIGTYPSF